MTNTMRTLVVIAGVTALAASSQAAITFSNLTTDFTVDPGASNQVDATPSSLSNYVFGAGSVTDSGSFQVAGSNGISELVVNEVDGWVLDGSLSLTVTLYNGTTVGSGVLDTLYSQSNTVALTPTHEDTLLSPSLVGPHLVTYSATYMGNSTASLGYLGGFAVDAYEAVPEPAPYAALGIGMIGLIARRRRNGK